MLEQDWQKPAQTNGLLLFSLLILDRPATALVAVAVLFGSFRAYEMDIASLDLPSSRLTCFAWLSGDGIEGLVCRGLASAHLPRRTLSRDIWFLIRRTSILTLFDIFISFFNTFRIVILSGSFTLTISFSARLFFCIIFCRSNTCSLESIALLESRFHPSFAVLSSGGSCVYAVLNAIRMCTGDRQS